MERILYGPSGMSTVGVPLLIGGQERILFAKLTNLLSDGDGHRMGWDWRGAASLKPCWKHFNVFRKDSGLAHRMPGYVEIDCSDPASSAAGQRARSTSQLTPWRLWRAKLRPGR